ncbi:hypothetical protein PAXRUDRAFT_421109 [Paxillus rubicundulus Ve08.2h10]|uniref:Uncharacterized protein n=1 Tax=Paxillus rubicundulus Ve08.2h10 TaxID=930991 RepID=A0A0D0E2K8_9AGAM|nr:hypothetical protein PAXRUDRAFT_421109 [Paxillus rubicundulus Ve08.2h10]
MNVLVLHVSTSSRLPVGLPPFLHLNIPQRNIDSLQLPEASRPTVASGGFSRTFYDLIFSTRLGYLEKVAEVTVDDGASPTRLPSVNDSRLTNSCLSLNVADIGRLFPLFYSQRKATRIGKMIRHLHSDIQNSCAVPVRRS